MTQSQRKELIEQGMVGMIDLLMLQMVRGHKDNNYPCRLVKNASQALTQDRAISSFFPHFSYISPLFSQSFFIFVVLNLALWVGDSSTRKGPAWLSNFSSSISPDYSVVIQTDIVLVKYQILQH